MCEFLKLIGNKALLLPLLYTVVLSAVPDFSDLCTFILLNKADWSLELVSFVTLSTGIIFSFFMVWFLSACMPKMPFYASFVIGAFGNGIYNYLMYTFL